MTDSQTTTCRAAHCEAQENAEANQYKHTSPLEARCHQVHGGFARVGCGIAVVHEDGRGIRRLVFFFLLLLRSKLCYGSRTGAQLLRSRRRGPHRE